MSNKARSWFVWKMMSTGAQLQSSKGNLAFLQAQLDQLLNGSRPEEIAKAHADLESARADLVNAR